MGAEERGRKRVCEIFAKKNNPGTLSNYIYLSCVVFSRRPCGFCWLHPGSFFKYLILQEEQGEQDKGCDGGGRLGSSGEDLGLGPGG